MASVDLHLEASSAGGGSLRGLLRSRVGVVVARTVIVALILLAWQFASGPLLSPVWFSSPTRVFHALVRIIADGSLWYHLQSTLLTVALGYSIGAALGVALGLLLGLLPRVEQVLSPFIASLWCLPKIALLPLFVIFLGPDMESKVALVATVVVFLVLYSAIDGVRDVDQALIDTLKLMGATKWEILAKVQFPSALPWIYTGLRISVSYALTTTVVGELLSSNRGLGYIMESAAARFEAAEVFAAVVVLVLLSVLITEGLTRMERHSSDWQHK